MRWIFTTSIQVLGLLLSSGHLIHADTVDERRAQEYLIHIWSSEDGLPQNSVNCLAQTPEGYLWAGTRSGGLARFDGLRFVVFNPQSTPELRDVEFETLSVDSRGTMWITAGNESVSALEDGRFRLVRDRNAAPRWHPLQLVAEDPNSVYLAAYDTAIYRVTADGAVDAVKRVELAPRAQGPLPGDILQAKDGSIWYLAESGEIARAEIGGDGESHVRTFQLESRPSAMSKDHNGRIWVSTGTRIGMMSDDGFQDQTPSDGPACESVLNLIASRDGGLWVWEGMRLRKMRAGRWTTTVQGFQPPRGLEALRFFDDGNGGLWAINYGVGLWHIKSDGSASLLTKQDGLPSALITCWLQDKEGNIWIGTKDKGLARIRPRWFKDFNAADGIPGDAVQSVCEDQQDRIWVGTTAGGLAYRKDGRFAAVSLPSVPGATLESVTVYPDSAKGVWIGTVKGGIFRWADDRLTRPFRLAELRNQTACALLLDSTGRVWLGNGSGAYLWQHGKLTTFGYKQGFVENEGVRALAEGPPGTIWFGTEPGDLWSYADGRLVRFSPPAAWAKARVSAILPDKDGVVWVGTLGNGLLRFHDGKFDRITTEHGLPDGSITQLLEDDSGHIWGGTYAGIFRAAKTDLASAGAGSLDRIPCPSYGILDGLPAQAFSGWFQPACWRSRDGRLWFSTINGLLSFVPNDVERNPHPPPVVIEELRVDGAKREFASRSARDMGTDAAGPLEIEPGRHYVEFLFTGLNFTAPDKVLFRWRLEPGESRWNESSKQRRANYGPLPPGSYRFRVLAANNDGVWNKEGATLEFVVLPHFWETWWFKAGLGLLALVLFAVGIAAMMRRRHRQQLERLERIHEVERERSRIARDLHDDIGTSLTRINMLSGLVSHKETSPAEVDDLTRQIRATSRKIVSELNEIVWAVNPKNDNLMELLGYVGNFAEAFCRNTSLRCRLKFDDNLPNYVLSSETRHNLFLACKEAVHNAVRHSAADELWLGAWMDGEELILTVADNGKGLVVGRQEPGRGNGLANMQQRLERIGGTCSFRQNDGRGTIVEFRLTFDDRSKRPSHRI